jgi:LysM repeat protein
MIRLKSLLTEASSAEITTEFKNLIKGWENNKDYAPGGWNKTKKKWFPHRSPEGGTATIAYGHKLTAADVASGKFNNGLTDDAALELLESDLETARSKAIGLVPSYATLPTSTKQALINACYRGELSKLGTPKTLELMRANKWTSAAKEYLDHAEYKSGGENIRNRMEWNAQRFKSTNSTKTTAVVKTPTPAEPEFTLDSAIDFVKQQFANLNTTPKPKSTTTNTYHTVQSGDTLSGLAVKYKTTVPNIKSLNNLKTDTIKAGQKLKVK